MSIASFTLGRSLLLLLLELELPVLLPELALDLLAICFFILHDCVGV